MGKFPVLAAILILLAQATAVQSQYRFKTWDQQRGLPANSCLSAMQDTKGYLWVTTSNGLSLFNGSSFREVGRFGKIPIEGEIRRITEDKAGRYWLASYEKGLILIDFNQKQEQQVQVFNSTTISGGIGPPFQSVNKLLDDRAGHIWVGTESNGLYRFNMDTKTFVHWPLHHPYSNYASFIRSLYLHQDGTIWVGMVNGLAHINPRTGVTTFPRMTYKNLQYSYAPTVRGICHWNKDTFALATDRGAHFYLAGSATLVPVFPLADSSDYKLQEYHDVLKFSNEELWFATTDKGVWHANVRRGKYSYSWQSPYADESIGRHPVYALYKDGSNNIWVSHAKGLSYLNPGNAQFKNHPFQFYIHQPPTKNFIAATDSGIAIIRPDSLFTWNVNMQQRKSYPLFKEGALQGNGFQVWWHRKYGYVYAGRDGIFHVDTMLRKAVPIIHKHQLPDGLRTSDVVVQLLIDTINRNEKWWIAAYESNRIFCYDVSQKKFSSLTLQPTTAAITGFSKMLIDPKGGLWVTTRQQGLFYFPDRTKDTCMHAAFNTPGAQPFAGNHIEDLVWDNKGAMWATVRNTGLVNIDWQHPERLQYQVFAKESGLTYLNLGQIQVDDNNNLWISSANGLYHFDQKRAWFNFFGQSNGLRDAVLTLGSAKDNKGNLYFASHNNLLYFHPKEIVFNTDNPPVKLRSVTVEGQVIEINNLSKLVLSPDEHTIAFYFDVLDYDNPNGHYLLCKLEGYDKKWLLLQDVYEQTYRSLPGGNYTFRIKKLGADGLAGAETKLHLVIQRVFYQKPWFRIMVALAVLLLLFAALKLYTFRKMEKAKAIMQQRQAIELERLRISTELHDDLGGELSAIRLVSEMAQMNTVENQQQNLRRISHSSAALVQKMNEIVWALNVNNDTLQSLVAYIHRYAVKSLEEVGISCRFTQPETMPNIEVDGLVRRSIFLLVKEALNNVVKHADASHVCISVQIGEQLTINIRDNGRGMPVPQRSYVGNGMRNMQQRVADLHGRMQLAYDGGTIINFEIPLAQTHTKV